MSENEDQPSKQTSSVPLKKETVRVTLKAADAPAAPIGGAPPAPAAPKPTVAPPAPSAPRPPTPTGAPPAPAATIPLKTAGGGAPAAAPTIKLSTPAGTGAPTIALKTPGGAPTGPIAGSVALPKATVQLAPPTQPLGTGAPSASQAPTMYQGSEEESEGSDTVAGVLSILGFLGAAAVVAFQAMTINIWEGWDKLF